MLIRSRLLPALPTVKWLIVGLFSTFFFAPFSVFSQVDDLKGIMRELRALDGTWFMPTDRGDRLEYWQIEDDSTFVGRGMRIKPENGDTVLLETMRIERRDTTISYIVNVRGQNQNRPIVFKLTQADYDGYLFENPAHDDPQKIRYLLLGNRELQVFTEGKRNNRTVTQEYVFEREFTPGSVEFRVRGGINANTLRGSGTLIPLSGATEPKFGWRPGWELGTQAVFNGRGGFVSINCEIGLAGRYSSANSAFDIFDDSLIVYRRDGTYSTLWLTLAVAPEITFKRDGRLSLLVGPYYGILLTSRLNGVVEPQGENQLFESNNDFKKNDLGVLAGLQYKLNFGKKDIGGKIGIRANLGLSDLDNLYVRTTKGTQQTNGRVSLMGVAVYYSVNLLQL
ncbi:MAG: PorT family protein [Saprospiraceae bacterium]|nr:PorT family protein [Saprospiraceae bacterium]